MCEVLFLTFFTVRIGGVTENRGYSPLLFRAVFVGVWMTAEGLGWYIAGSRTRTEEMGIMRVWVVGFIAALVSTPLVFVVLFLPNKGTSQRTGAFGDYRDQLEPKRYRRKKSRRRKRAEDEANDPGHRSFHV